MLLSWQTANEINSNFFEVQRSVTGINTWSDIGVVTAAGNSSIIILISLRTSQEEENLFTDYNKLIRTAKLIIRKLLKVIVVLQELKFRYIQYLQKIF